MTTKSSNPALVRLGETIRQRREALNLSQEQVSFDAEIDRSYLSQVESGTRNPTYLTLLGIAKALRVGVRELLPPQ